MRNNFLAEIIKERKNCFNLPLWSAKRKKKNSKDEKKHVQLKDLEKPRERKYFVNNDI